MHFETSRETLECVAVMADNSFARKLTIAQKPLTEKVGKCSSETAASAVFMPSLCTQYSRTASPCELIAKDHIVCMVV